MHKTITIYILLFIGLIRLDAGITAEQFFWGFDGRIATNRFNPVAIMFSNPSPEAFEGQISFQKTDGIGIPIGTPQVQHIFLGPYSHRWVQFYPYIRSSQEKWRCFWGRRKGESFIVTVPSKGAPAIVFFAAGNSMISSKRIRIKTFPEHLFPSSVSMTSNLKAVVLENMPEFTPVQNNAFLNWIKGGGTVYLLPDSGGSYPRFSGKLSTINSSENILKIESGKVEKLPTTITHISPASIGMSPPEVKKKDDKKNQHNDYYKEAGTADELFRQLRTDVKTNHNWGLIAFITVIYILLIVVANFFIARKSRKPLKPLLFFVLTVFVFSLIFAFIGRRGYGEKSQISSISYAKSLGDGNFDVAQWMNIFVTSGDDYRITHPAECNFYSTCQTMERVNGVTGNGIKGSFIVDIPLYSSKSLYHRAMMSAPKAKIKSVSLKSDGMTLQALKVTLDRGFPGKVEKGIAVCGEFLYDLDFSKSKKELSLTGNSTAMQEYRQNWTNSYYGFQQNKDFVEVVKSMIPALIFRTKEKENNEVNLYILSGMPDSFKAQGEKIKKENGYTLYHFKLKNRAK